MAGPPSVREIVLAVRRGCLSPAESLQECIRRINGQSGLNAFLWVNQEASGQGRAGDAAGLRPLEGVPVALKDNIDTRGIPTTSGSVVDRDRIPSADATVWARLRDVAGMLLAGKAHMSEFAYRSHNPVLGHPRNPRMLDRAPGGSSSGSAVAVAGGLVPVALGTDTGGSVRIPAAYCGVIGLKGTHGLVETTGVVPLSQTMDHAGVLANSVSDAALVLEQMAARPLRLADPDTLQVPRPDPRAVRLGVARGYLGSGAQAGVMKTWQDGVRQLGKAGCTVVPVDVEGAVRWRAAHKTVLLFEAWSSHAARMTDGAAYGEVFASALRAGSRISQRQYEDALIARDKARSAMAGLFSGQIDVLTTPTCPTVAPVGDQGITGVSYTRYTTLAAFAGLPAISIPAQTNRIGLPVGLQLIAAEHCEATLIGVAALAEAVLARKSQDETV